MESVKEKRVSKPNKKYVIVRSANAGVCAGFLEKQSKDGRRVMLSQSRRLWYWKGAASLHQLANEGVKCPNECKFPAVLEGLHDMPEVCEVLEVTPKAKKSIESVPIWSA